MKYTKTTLVKPSTPTTLDTLESIMIEQCIGIMNRNV